MKKYVLCILSLVLLVSGCRQQSVDKSKPSTINDQTVTLFAERPKASSEHFVSVADASNQLSLDMLRQILYENPKDNVVFSPMSLAQDCALLYESANGDSRKTIVGLLKVDNLSEGNLASFHSAFLADIASDKDQTLKMANAIWIKDQYPLDPKMTKRLDTVYGCSVKAFPNDLVAAKKEMDAWVDQKTQGMIKEIKTDLGNEIYALFLNALYFDGQWGKPFKEEDTSTKPFHAFSGDVNVSMMQMPEAYLLACFDTEKPGVCLPFKGGKHSFMAIVPRDANAMRSFVSAMSARSILAYRKGLRRGSFILEFPKLDLSSTYDLKSAFEGLGAGSLFVPPLNLSRLIPKQATAKDSFRISSVIQQTKLKLDEMGAKASSITEAGSMTAEIIGEPKRIAFNRPFLYFIIHEQSGAIVLCGIVNDPTKS